MSEAAPNPAAPSDPAPTPNPAPGGKGADPAGGSPAPSDKAPAAAQRPENLPEQFWDAEAGAPKIDDLLTEYHGLSAFKAERDAVAAAVPESADKYEAKLPDGLDLPEGIEISLDPDDPIRGPVLKKAQAFAHERGLSQEDFGNLLGLAAENQAAEFKAMQEQSRAEMESLGANANARVDAVTRWLTGRLGESQAKSMLGVLFTKTQVEAFENLMRQFTSRGVPAPSGAGRDTTNGQAKGWDANTSTLRKFATALGVGDNR